MTRMFDVVPPTKVDGSMWLFQVDVAQVICLTLWLVVGLVVLLIAVSRRRRSWRDYQQRKPELNQTVGQCSCQGHQYQSPWAEKS